MTELLEQALEAILRAPPRIQDEIAKFMLDMIDDGEDREIPAEHLAAVLEGEGQAARGEFATDEQVAAAFRTFDR
jgi:Ca2+-binding EF-hand superfamily protein